MCKFRHKVRNDQNIPPKIKLHIFHFRLLKTYSFNLSLKNTLGLYVSENFGQETKI